jgi:hypothetical protein
VTSASLAGGVCAHALVATSSAGVHRLLQSRTYWRILLVPQLAQLPTRGIVSQFEMLSVERLVKRGACDRPHLAHPVSVGAFADRSLGD